ncbi:hypothetical protein M8818_007054 [Zalaria obscura]|uniref:Uncharacterized protein n=1 Tax=Zalaria obscura TaxID=2024903 RepID=A0ACC3S3X1_9PEZI
MTSTYSLHNALRCSAVVIELGVEHEKWTERWRFSNGRGSSLMSGGPDRTRHIPADPGQKPSFVIAIRSNSAGRGNRQRTSLYRRISVCRIASALFVPVAAESLTYSSPLVRGGEPAHAYIICCCPDQPSGAMRRPNLAPGRRIIPPSSSAGGVPASPWSSSL